MGVPTFGNLRINAYLQLPAAYRSLSRPSSAPNAKAFSICSSSLELLLYIWRYTIGSRFSRLNCCVFHTCSLRLFIVFGKIVSFYPLRKNLISIRRFYSAVYDFQFPFTFVCHVCHIYSLKNQYVISLIRFSMSILFSLTLVKLVRHLIFHQVP